VNWQLRHVLSDVSMMVRRQLNYSLNRYNLQLFELFQEIHCVAMVAELKGAKLHAQFAAFPM
jgi:hypothetical protein